VIKKLETMVHEFKELELDIDLESCKNALKYLRKIKGKDEYSIFVTNLLAPCRITTK